MYFEAVVRELVGTVGRPFGQAMEEAHYGQAEGVFENCQDCLAGVGLCRWEGAAEPGLLRRWVDC